MNIAEIPQSTPFKKRSYYAFIILLTLGASLIVGLLSFGGFFAIWPSLILASASFVLSVVYEGEIFFQNIKGALAKLFDPQYIPDELGKSFLKTYFPHKLTPENRPKFFNQYEKLLKKHHFFEHEPKTEDNAAEAQDTRDMLTELERYFIETIQLPPDQALDKLALEQRALFLFLKQTRANKTQSILDYYQQSLKARQQQYRYVQLFSALAAMTLSIGTTYLLMEVFTIIPFLAAIPLGIVPALIIPMSIIAGIAYGLLTYNTITSMIHHDTIRKHIKNIRDDIKENGLTFRNSFKAIASVALATLAVALTLCTAGTWWTILHETRPVLTWMSKIPRALIAGVTAVVTSLAALAFNLENSSESLEQMDQSTRPPALKEAYAAIKQQWQAIRDRENIVQLLNPFRLILALTITPLRLIFFGGHLISISVTADRVPGVSKKGSAALGLFSELLEDLHFFFRPIHVHKHDTKSLLDERLDGEGHGHNHDHNTDMPTRVIIFLATPLYALAKLWHITFEKLNSPKPTPDAVAPAATAVEPVIIKSPTPVAPKPVVNPVIGTSTPVIQSKLATPIEEKKETVRPGTVNVDPKSVTVDLENQLFCQPVTLPPPKPKPTKSRKVRANEILGMTFASTDRCARPGCANCPPASSSETSSSDSADLEEIASEDRTTARPLSS